MAFKMSYQKHFQRLKEEKAREEARLLEEAQAKMKVILDKVNELLAAKKEVRFVNVHSVGSEFRIGNCSIENIMGKSFIWYCGREKTHLTKEQYEQVNKILNDAWEAQPVKVFEDRGLY